MAVYNGKEISLSIDGRESIALPVTGNIRNTPFPVNIGRNVEIHGQETTAYICDAIIDQVGIFSKMISTDVLKNPSSELKKQSALWLDFEEMQEGGEFFSYGIGARTYGSIWPDRRPQPEMWQIKKSAQPVTVKLISAEKGEIAITNRYLFTNLSELLAEWILQGDGEVLDKGIIQIDLPPQNTSILTIPLKKPELEEGVEYRLLVRFSQKSKSPWGETGFEIAWDQMELPWFMPVMNKEIVSTAAITMKEDKEKAVVSGREFSYTFDKKTGTLISMRYKGRELIKNGAELNVWRAPLANETDEWGFWRANKKHFTNGYGRVVATEWYSSGLDNLQSVNELFSVKQIDNQCIAVEVRNVMMLGTRRGAFLNHFIYRIDSNGELVIDHSVVPDGDMPSWLPRVGVEWILDNSLNNVQWYGRGPQENYPDRKSGYKTDVYKSTVVKMYEPYLIPQDYGLRCDNRWVRVTDDNGTGLEFKGDKLFNFSAHPYSTENLTKALYTYQLHPFDGITLNLDYITSGVGCTALSVFTRYQVMPQRYDFRMTVRPVDQ